MLAVVHTERRDPNSRYAIWHRRSRPTRRTVRSHGSIPISTLSAALLVSPRCSRTDHSGQNARSPAHARPPRRHSGRRQRHSHEVRVAEGAAPDRGTRVDRPRRSTPPIRWRPQSTTVVVGHGADHVRAHLADGPTLTSWSRNPSLGPGTRSCKPRRACGPAAGPVVLLSGDVPLLSRQRAARAGRTASRGARRRDGSDGSGRRPVRIRPHRAVARVESLRIVEERDASPAQRKIARNQFRHLCLRARAVVRRARQDRVRQRARESITFRIWSRSIGGGGASSRRSAWRTAVEIRGINSRTELAEVSRMVRQQKNEELMAAGVTLDRSGDDLYRLRRGDRARHRRLSVRVHRRHDTGLERPARFTLAAGSSTRPLATARSSATTR